MYSPPSLPSPRGPCRPNQRRSQPVAPRRPPAPIAPRWGGTWPDGSGHYGQWSWGEAGEAGEGERGVGTGGGVAALAHVHSRDRGPARGSGPSADPWRSDPGRPESGRVLGAPVLPRKALRGPGRTPPPPRTHSEGDPAWPPWPPPGRASPRCPRGRCPHGSQVGAGGGRVSRAKRCASWLSHPSRLLSHRTALPRPTRGPGGSRWPGH